MSTERASLLSLREIRQWIADRDDPENPIVPIHEAALTALLDVADAIQTIRNHGDKSRVLFDRSDEGKGLRIGLDMALGRFVGAREKYEMCKCGHQARHHVMLSQQQRCEATVYTDAPLGGGNAFTCHCRQFVTVNDGE